MATKTLTLHLDEMGTELDKNLSGECHRCKNAFTNGGYSMYMIFSVGGKKQKKQTLGKRCYCMKCGRLWKNTDKQQKED